MKVRCNKYLVVALLLLFIHLFDDINRTYAIKNSLRNSEFHVKQLPTGVSEGVDSVAKTKLACIWGGLKIWEARKKRRGPIKPSFADISHEKHAKVGVAWIWNFGAVPKWSIGLPP